MFKHHSFALSLSLLLSTPAVYAAATQLPEMHIETDAAESLTDAPYQAPASDLGEVLRDTAGVSASRMGGRSLDPIVRGQNPNRLQVLIDGAQVHGGCPNRMDPPSSYVQAGQFDQLRVLKGAERLRQGSGPAVVLERSAPQLSSEKPYHAEFEAAYQSDSHEPNVGADVTLGSAQFYARMQAHYDQAKNYKDGDGRSVRSSYESRNTGLSLGYRPNKDSLLELSAENSREDDVLYAGAGMDAPESENDLVRLKFSHRLSAQQAVQGALYQSQVEHVMDNYSLRPLTSSMKMSAPSSSDTRGGFLEHHWQSQDYQGSFGLDMMDLRQEARRYAGMASVVQPTLLQSLMWPDVEQQKIGLYADLRGAFAIGSRWGVGLRYERVNSDAKAAAQSVMGTSPNDLYQQYYGSSASERDENLWSGFLRYERDFAANWQGFVHLSRSSRSADANERFMASNNTTAAMRWVGNPELDAEKHHQIELGLVHPLGTHNSGTLSLFYNRVSDYILRDRAHGQDGVLLADNASIYRNISARFYGLEWETNWQWQQWAVDFGIAYVHATNLDDSRALAQTPPLEGTIDLRYQWRRTELGSRLRWAARQTRVDDSMLIGSGLDAGETGGFAVLDLYLHHRFNAQWQLSAGVDNAFDRSYAYHVNRANSDPFSPDAVRVNEPGRQYWLRLKAQF